MSGGRLSANERLHSFSISAMYACRTGSSSVILYPRFFRLFLLSRLSLGGPGFTRPLPSDHASGIAMTNTVTSPAAAAPSAVIAIWRPCSLPGCRRPPGRLPPCQ